MGGSGDIGQTAETRGVRSAATAFLRAFADYAGWRGVGAAALVGVSAIVDGASIVLLIPILGVVVPGNDATWRTWLDGPLAALGADTVLQRLGVLLAVFLLVAGLRAALLYARDIVLAQLQAGFVEQLRNRTLQTLAQAPWNAIVTLRHARITNLLGTEMQRVASSAQFLIQATVAAVLLVVQCLLAFSLAPGFALVAMLLLAIGAGFVIRGHARSRDMGSETLRQSQAAMSSATGFLGGLKAAAAQNDQGHFTREFSAIQVLLRERQLTFQRRQARSRVAFALVSSLAGAGVIFGGVAWGVAPPVLIALILLFARMSGPAQQIQSATQNFYYGLPSFEGIRTLERDLRHDDPAALAPVAPPPGPVSLHAVRYLHPGGGGVKRADLAIAPGTFVGITGPSGAGKTTLVDILIGLLPSQEGEMRIGGAAVDAALLAGWRQGIAYVPQDGFLFHDSVRRNLSWDDSADDAAIARATALAGADVVIARLEHGLQTVIGERGAILSGGERQRIALARALLRNPRLLVLDEAANAIDAAGEAALLARLAALEPRPTILMISHRAESMALCDRVIRVERGIVTTD